MDERSAPQLAQYAEKCLARNPEIRFAVLFAPSARGIRALAALMLAHELFETSFGLSDQRVAESKLSWWAHELAESQAGRASHPLTRALAEAGFADFTGAITAASALTLEFAAATPADFVSQVGSARLWALGLARLYATPCDRPAVLEACCTVFVAMGLLRKLQLSARPGRYGPAVLPMSMLAKHQLSASSLGEQRAAAAIGEQAERLMAFLSGNPPPAAFAELSALAANVRLTARAIARGAHREFPRVNPFSRLYLGWRAALSARSQDQSP